MRLEALEGAVESFKLKGKNYGRMAIASCRSAIEDLCILHGGESSWGAGLDKLVTGRNQRTIVGRHYGHLSALGEHSLGQIPSDEEVETSIVLTLASIRIILGKRSAR